MSLWLHSTPLGNTQMNATLRDSLEKYVMVMRVAVVKEKCRTLSWDVLGPNRHHHHDYTATLSYKLCYFCHTFLCYSLSNLQFYCHCSGIKVHSSSEFEWVEWVSGVLASFSEFMSPPGGRLQLYWWYQLKDRIIFSTVKSSKCE